MPPDLLQNIKKDGSSSFYHRIKSARVPLSAVKEVIPLVDDFAKQVLDPTIPAPVSKKFDLIINSEGSDINGNPFSSLANHLTARGFDKSEIIDAKELWSRLINHPAEYFIKGARAGDTLASNLDRLNGPQAEAVYKAFMQLYKLQQLNYSTSKNIDWVDIFFPLPKLSTSSEIPSVQKTDFYFTKPDSARASIKKAGLGRLTSFVDKIIDNAMLEDPSNLKGSPLKKLKVIIEEGIARAASNTQRVRLEHAGVFTPVADPTNTALSTLGETISKSKEFQSLISSLPEGEQKSFKDYAAQVVRESTEDIEKQIATKGDIYTLPEEDMYLDIERELANIPLERQTSEEDYAFSLAQRLKQWNRKNNRLYSKEIEPLLEKGNILSDVAGILKKPYITKDELSEAVHYINNSRVRIGTHYMEEFFEALKRGDLDLAELERRFPVLNNLEPETLKKVKDKIFGPLSSLQEKFSKIPPQPKDLSASPGFETTPQMQAWRRKVEIIQNSASEEINSIKEHLKTLESPLPQSTRAED